MANSPLSFWKKGYIPPTKNRENLTLGLWLKTGITGIGLIEKRLFERIFIYLYFQYFLLSARQPPASHV
jgi:hypothetical protein